MLLSGGAATALAAISVLASAAASGTAHGAGGGRRRVVGDRHDRRPAPRAPGPDQSPDRPPAGLGARLQDAARAAPQRGPRQQAVAAGGVHAAVRRARLPGAPDPGHRGRLRDHGGARLAPPGRGRGGHRGARRSRLLRRAHLARARDLAGAHPGLQPPRGPNASTGPWASAAGRWRPRSSSRCCSSRSAPPPGCASPTSSCATRCAAAGARVQLARARASPAGAHDGADRPRLGPGGARGRAARPARAPRRRRTAHGAATGAGRR